MRRSPFFFRMSQDKTYNGHSNYETWVVCLWDFVDQCMDTCVEGDHWDVDDQWCKENFEMMYEQQRDALVGPLADAVSAFISEVDWRSIASQVQEAIVKHFEHNDWELPEEAADWEF